MKRIKIILSLLILATLFLASACDSINTLADRTPEAHKTDQGNVDFIAYDEYNEKLTNTEKNYTVLEETQQCTKCNKGYFLPIETNYHDWKYAEGVRCKHSLEGVDYIFHRQVETTFTCNNCGLAYNEKVVEEKLECIGVEKLLKY